MTDGLARLGGGEASGNDSCLAGAGGAASGGATSGRGRGFSFASTRAVEGSAARLAGGGATRGAETGGRAVRAGLDMPSSSEDGCSKGSAWNTSMTGGP